MNNAFERHSLEKNENGYTLVLYLNPWLTEFAREIMDGKSDKQQSVMESINSYIKQNLAEIKITNVKIMIGALLVATLPFSTMNVSAQENTLVPVIEQTEQQDVQTNYVVKPGDSIWTISRSFNVNMDSLRSTNNLSTDMIFVGQSLKIPSTDQIPDGVIHNEGLYQVKAGDTLYYISVKYNTTVLNLKTLNNLNGDTIYIGQQLKVPTANTTDPLPVPASTPSPSISSDTYTVQAGDTLWKIAMNNATTIDNIKKLNGLSSDTIYIGQVLKLNEATASNPQAPSITYTSHTVASGENPWSISIKYGIPLNEVLTANNLSTNSVLQIGQVLKIPVHSIPVKNTPGDMYGELLDWWTEAQYVVPIGTIAKVTDFESGRSFVIKRTIGANHADSEPLTAEDAAIMKEIWGGSYSWSPRAVIVEADERKLAASMSSMPHSIQYITDNDYNGHFDLHFLNSTRHSDGLVDPSHQMQISIAAGVK